MSVKHKGTEKVETERLILRRFKEDDVKAIYETWLSDPEVSKYMIWNYQEDIEDTKKWLQKCIEKYKNDNIYNWGIELKETNNLVGSISANKSENDEECYEIGYTIGRRYWGNGYATEALKKVTEYLIKEVGIRKFLCRYAKENIASKKVIKKVGFEYLGKGNFISLDGKRNFESEEYYLEK